MAVCDGLSFSNNEEESDCVPYKCDSDLSLIDSTGSGFVTQRPKTHLFRTSKPPNIEHEFNVAKSLLQQGSLLTGDNTFDHLADLIKYVIKHRPENIADYFEEFSHNLREQKFRIPEQFPWNHYDPLDATDAKNLFKLIKVPSEVEYDVCKLEQDEEKCSLSSSSSASALKAGKFQRKLLFFENVRRLHLYWSLCGFGLDTEEVQKLAYSLEKLQFQPNVEYARFWGKIYCLKKCYYIAEVKLTRDEEEIRLDKMREEMVQKMCLFRQCSEQSVNTSVDIDLIPGVQWQDQPEEELKRMQPAALPIPRTKLKCQFDIPPEPIGTGLNRRAYFVVNSLDDEWIELPIVTPKQVQISRHIRKLFTGDLEADIIGYPNFPGTEKHYLRAMIARITAGTYIAPNGYYRKLTKKERMEAMGEEMKAPEEEEELEVEEEEEEIDNDALITENIDYKPRFKELLKPKGWVHFRPHILDQGRIVYFDEVAARKALERESLLRLRGEGGIYDEEEGEGEGEEENVIEDEDITKGPALFTDCSNDINEEECEGWSVKYSSSYNKVSQGVLIRSNLWPGAYSFAFDNYCDSIYLGWGFKYIARNMTVLQVPAIYDEYLGNYAEATDPTVAMELAWQEYLQRQREFLEEVFDEEEEIC